jgi:hypothetical protein
VIEKKEGLIMLEKAKNRKIFYFFLFIILGISLFISPISADDFSDDLQGSLSEGLEERGTATWVTTDDYTYHSSNTEIDYKTVSLLVTGNSINNYEMSCEMFWTSSSFASFVYGAEDSGIYGKVIQFQGTQGIYLYSNLDTSSGTKIYTGTFAANVWHSFRVIVNSTHVSVYENETFLVSSSLHSTLGLMGVGSYYAASGTYMRNFVVDDLDAAPCDAEIDVFPSSGASPLAVSFTDKSTGFTEGVDLVYLDYGDGNSFSGTYPGYDATRNYIYLDAGTYNYSYRLTNDGINYYDNGTVTVTGDSTVNFQVIVRGLNGAYIGNATVNIWYDSGTMIDSDITDDFYGSADFYVNPSRYVNGNVTKGGYYTSNFTYYVCPTGYCNNEVWITLYTINETPGSGDEFGNYLVTFKNANSGVPVPYSNIEVYSDSGYTTLYYDEYSNAGGVWTGLVPMNIDLYYKYPETTSYYSQTWSYNLTSSPSYKTVNLIPKSGATSTTTPTPTTTTTTITPTVTYTYNDSNLSTLNVKERITNLLVLAGFQNAESADLIFAMIIVLGCTALIGWITLSGSGAGMGAIIGFVFSLGLGLIPLWLLIAAIFFGCLYVALKLFGGSGE